MEEEDLKCTVVRLVATRKELRDTHGSTPVLAPVPTRSPASSTACSRSTTTTMEGLTLTIGAAAHWREIAAPRCCHGAAEAPAGFLRLSLDDEALGVTPAPPCEPRLDYATSGLAELRGDLCVARMAPGRVLEMWMAGDAVRPRWERRYAIQVANPLRPSRPRPVALLDDATIVIHDIGWTAYAYHVPTRGFQEIRLQDIDYRHPTAPAIRCFSHFVLIPYRESLLPVHKPSFI